MVLLVLCTFPDPDVAAEVVRTLVGEKLAACGNILPGIRSIYAWQGTIEDTAEVAVLLKTTGAAYAKLEKRLTKLHPYEVPEIIAWETGAVAKPYAAWLAAEMESTGS
jgi:periplasmic divalent cation tolerance protein